MDESNNNDSKRSNLQYSERNLFELLNSPTSIPTNSHSNIGSTAAYKTTVDGIAISVSIISIILTFSFFFFRRKYFDSMSDKENKNGLGYYDYAVVPANSPRNERSVVLRKVESDMSSKVLSIRWSDIKAYGTNPLDSIVGKGSFGIVFRAILQTREMDVDIVVKVIKQTGKSSDDRSLIQTAFEECRKIKEAESKMVYKDCIVKVYGIANGLLPTDCADIMNVQSAIGIVMRYEGGGTITNLIHPAATDSGCEAALPINTAEKIRLITGLARGLVELHSAGIVHGDIKPDNILLSSDDPPEVRLADFGLARMREEYEVGFSSLNETKHTKGTLLYCAPEMMVNPYIDMSAANALVAKASRKSDMYAFAIVSWEILTCTKPFDDVKKETALAMKVHQGGRPSISHIPSDCPKRVVDMIQLCWDGDRSMRESALRCFSKLQYEYRHMTNAYADVCLSYHESNRKVCEYYYQRLTQLGCKVCILDKDNLISENESLLANSLIMIAFLNTSYQQDGNCMNELKKARQLSQPSKMVVAVFTEPDYSKWADIDIYYLCQLRSQIQKRWDVSDIVVENDSKLLSASYGSESKDDSNTTDSTNININIRNSDGTGETDEEMIDFSLNVHYNAYIDDAKSFIDDILKIKRKKYLERFDLKQSSSSDAGGSNDNGINSSMVDSVDSSSFSPNASGEIRLPVLSSADEVSASHYVAWQSPNQNENDASVANMNGESINQLASDFDRLGSSIKSPFNTNRQIHFKAVKNATNAEQLTAEQVSSHDTHSLSSGNNHSESDVDPQAWGVMPASSSSFPPSSLNSHDMV